MEEELDTDARASAPQDREARSFSSELTGALLDLARLARKAGAITTEQGTRDIASALLTRLLSLCTAQRGAVLLVSAHPALPTLVSAQTQTATKPLRLLACQDMPEQDVTALVPLLLAMPSDLSTIQGGADVSCWLLSHWSLNDPVRDQSAQNHQEERIEPGEPSMQAYLLLGWDNLAEQSCTPALEYSRMLLGQLADAIGAVLGSLHLAAHVQELETQGGKGLHETDVLSGDLLAVVSHELRSPLTAIKGYASTLLRHASRLSHEERSQFLLAISEASDRLDRLIGRLLELAQLENGSIPFAPVPLDPARLAEAALLAAQQQVAGQAPDRFTFQLRLETVEGGEAESVPLTWADPRLLREALDTLLDNAMKYSPEGGVITVVLRQTTPGRVASVLPSLQGEPGASVRDLPKELLELCVCDQGIGIPAAHIGRVFERFYQEDRRLSREAGGAGLGLSLCRQIVELHHGRIWVESRPGEGSTFHLVVPILHHPAKEQEQDRIVV